MKKTVIMITSLAIALSFATNCPAGQGEGPASGDPALVPPKKGEARRKFDECMRKCRRDFDSCNEPVDKPAKDEQKRSAKKAAADCSKIKSACEKECRENYKKNTRPVNK